MTPLLPWISYDDTGLGRWFVRRDIQYKVIGEVILDTNMNLWAWAIETDDDPDSSSLSQFKSATSAKKACDAALLRRGYRFIKKKLIVLI